MATARDKASEYINLTYKPTHPLVWEVVTPSLTTYFRSGGENYVASLTGNGLLTIYKLHERLEVTADKEE